MLLLRQIDEGLGISRSLAGCFYDGRNPLLIEHSVRELVAQRLLGLAAGYEDLNDHNLLRLDPLFAVAVGKEDPLGSGRAPVKVAAGEITRLRADLAAINAGARFCAITQRPLSPAISVWRSRRVFAFYTSL
jgi:hypothetical protein